MKELIAIQAGLHAPKNNTNNFGGYQYRSAEDILKALKPLLVDAGCCLTLSDQPLTRGGKITKTSTTRGDDGSAFTEQTEGKRVYICSTATLVNSEGSTVSAEGWAREPLEKKGMDPAQVTGSTASYARKYALGCLFLIDNEPDPDATNQHGLEAKAKTPPKPKPKPKGKPAPAAKQKHGPLHAIGPDIKAVSKRLKMDVWDFLSAELGRDITAANVQDVTTAEVLIVTEVVAAEMKQAQA